MLAEQLPDPSHAVLLHSVGRCGSTLLCKALGQLGDVVALSEPDVYTHIAGMRPSDGSRDQELTELAGSPTRFLCRSEPPQQGAVRILKFCSQCIEMADLLHEACPNAHALFLARDFTGWTRSMGRMSKIHDLARETRYQRNRSNLTMFTYPRDRYISLLRADPTPPETRLEDIALHRASVIKRFLDLYSGVIRYSLTYNDLTRHPERALQAVATACRIRGNGLDDALAIFEHGSQAGTDLAGRLLREQSAHELTEDDLRRAQAVAQRHGLEPDIVEHLPGHLLNS